MLEESVDRYFIKDFITQSSVSIDLVAPDELLGIEGTICVLMPGRDKIANKTKEKEERLRFTYLVL
jgi:hypothetical protein